MVLRPAYTVGWFLPSFLKALESLTLKIVRLDFFDEIFIPASDMPDEAVL